MRCAILLLFLAPGVALAAPPTPEGVAAGLRDCAERQDSVRLLEVGKSREGHPLLSLLVAAPGGAVEAGRRPRLLVVAGLNPDQLAGIRTASILADHLVVRAEEDPALRSLLETAEVEILPLANPDGLSALAAGPARELRTNLRPVDDDRDGRVDEDGPEDLDGDGRITWMRVRDPGGTHRVSPEDERLLVPVSDEDFEQATYRLYREGLDNDHDGRVNEDGPGGVDLDRNFPAGWDRYDRSCGPSCPSEPASRALADHVLAHPNIFCVLVYGHRETLLAVPEEDPGEDGVPFAGPSWGDLTWYREVVARVVLGGDPEAMAEGWADGGFHHWVFYQRGVPAFSTRLFAGPDPVEGEEEFSPRKLLLSWSDRALAGKGFTPWKTYEHPTLGTVEVGGLDPLLALDPPPDRIEELADEQAALLAGLLELRPRAVLRGAKARSLAPGLYEVSVTLVNEGVFPVTTETGSATGEVPPIFVDLAWPAREVLQGDRRRIVNDLLGAGRSRTLRWLVRGKPLDKVRVQAGAARVGTVSVEVEL